MASLGFNLVITVQQSVILKDTAIDLSFAIPFAAFHISAIAYCYPQETACCFRYMSCLPVYEQEQEKIWRGGGIEAL